MQTPWTTPDIWLRREVNLPNALPSKMAFLVFHDEDVEIYVNGVLAASAKGYVGDYEPLPISQAGGPRSSQARTSSPSTAIKRSAGSI